MYLINHHVICNIIHTMMIQGTRGCPVIFVSRQGELIPIVDPRGQTLTL